VALILAWRKTLRRGGTGKSIQGQKGGQTKIANMKFQTRQAAVDAGIIEINGLLDKGQRPDGSE
jgi:hypothetical protein